MKTRRNFKSKLFVSVRGKTKDFLEQTARRGGGGGGQIEMAS